MNGRRLISNSILILLVFFVFVVVWRAAKLLLWGFGDSIFNVVSFQTIVEWIIPSFACGFLLERSEKSNEYLGGILLFLWWLEGVVSICFIVTDLYEQYLNQEIEKILPYSDQRIDVSSIIIAIIVITMFLSLILWWYIDFHEFKSAQICRRIAVSLGVFSLCLIVAGIILRRVGILTTLVHSISLFLGMTILLFSVLLFFQNVNPHYKRKGILIAFFIANIVWTGYTSYYARTTQINTVYYNDKKYMIVFSDNNYYYCVDQQDDSNHLLLSPSGIEVKSQKIEKSFEN